MKVYLDSAPENITPALALDAAYILDGTWNGWAQPVATAAAWGDFLDRWRANDPNGDWGYATEVGTSLVSSRESVDDPDVFPKVGETAAGESLYDLSGLVWIVPGDWGTPAP